MGQCQDKFSDRPPAPHPGLVSQTDGPKTKPCTQQHQFQIVKTSRLWTHYGPKHRWCSIFPHVLPVLCVVLLLGGGTPLWWPLCTFQWEKNICLYVNAEFNSVDRGTNTVPLVSWLASVTVDKGKRNILASCWRNTPEFRLKWHMI